MHQAISNLLAIPSNINLKMDIFPTYEQAYEQVISSKGIELLPEIEVLVEAAFHECMNDASQRYWGCNSGYYCEVTAVDTLFKYIATIDGGNPVKMSYPPIVRPDNNWTVLEQWILNNTEDIPF